jgi:hypothetical protein
MVPFSQKSSEERFKSSLSEERRRPTGKCRSANAKTGMDRRLVSGLAHLRVAHGWEAGPRTSGKMEVMRLGTAGWRNAKCYRLRTLSAISTGLGVLAKSNPRSETLFPSARPLTAATFSKLVCEDVCT